MFFLSVVEHEMKLGEFGLENSDLSLELEILLFEKSGTQSDLVLLLSAQIT